MTKNAGTAIVVGGGSGVGRAAVMAWRPRDAASGPSAATQAPWTSCGARRPGPVKC